ncbi:hypothetical protein Salat_2650700 [Sesamum alatum]|uniref:Uncharacterized protein n=1 Tax=Sesamum alatum TaxID=300844 RepID=A0AAE1XP21_9LAMI|nr:hypothetical protein Salat_2650700 [Sesamum alatum]
MRSQRVPIFVNECRGFIPSVRIATLRGRMCFMCWPPVSLLGRRAAGQGISAGGLGLWLGKKVVHVLPSFRVGWTEKGMANWKKLLRLERLSNLLLDGGWSSIIVEGDCAVLITSGG